MKIDGTYIAIPQAHMKKDIIQYFWRFVLSMLMLVEASMSYGSLRDCDYDSSLLTISVEAKNKCRLPIAHSIKKKNLSNKNLKLFINEFDFQLINPHKDKTFNDLIFEIKKPQSSSLYEFNFMENKSDINSIIFHFLPFFNLKSQNNNNGQLSKQTMITLLQIDFF